MASFTKICSFVVSIFMCKFINVSSLFLLFQAVHAIAQTSLIAEAGENNTICKGNTIQLSGFATGGELPYIYSWTPTILLNDPAIANPTTVSLSTTTLFYFTVTDGQENSSTDSVIIYVDSISSYEQCNPLMFYNTFTPNKDGVNDSWTIKNANKYPNNYIEIYNRSGKLLYKASGYNSDWNGTYSGDDLPAATYYYIFDPGPGNNIGIKKGSVTIIR